MAAKTPLSEDASATMARWRAQGCWEDVPASYVRFHADLAVPALDALVKNAGLILHKTWLESDGWFDGMRVLYATVEEPSGRRVKLSWHDGNQEFFEHGSGSWPYRFTMKKGVSP